MNARIGEKIASFAAGLLFGAGLLVSGMANPAKVVGFLDIFGAWDPSLALVMGGAVGVGLVGFAFASRRATSALGLPMYLSANQRIDRRLVLGAAVFGVGWGLAGFCPGPALVSLATGSPKAILFVGSMLAGMALFELWGARRRPG
ncbi:MAG TPA: DUF6691 family protein [Usitatibacter sp.]|jgi:hypothetical protein|nr:DUF6691 family protein [Usitatibacter sp.]